VISRSTLTDFVQRAIHLQFRLFQLRSRGIGELVETDGTGLQRIDDTMQWVIHTLALSESSIRLLAHLVRDVVKTRDDPGLDQYGQGCQTNKYRQKILIDHDAL
jgi:hypothetical protein